MGFKFSGIDIRSATVNGCRIEHIVGTREWAVYRDGICVKICDTRRQAMEYCKALQGLS